MSSRTPSGVAGSSPVSRSGTQSQVGSPRTPLEERDRAETLRRLEDCVSRLDDATTDAANAATGAALWAPVWLAGEVCAAHIAIRQLSDSTQALLDQLEVAS